VKHRTKKKRNTKQRRKEVKHKKRRREEKHKTKKKRNITHLRREEKHKTKNNRFVDKEKLMLQANRNTKLARILESRQVVRLINGKLYRQIKTEKKKERKKEV
jgi:hypothetical protein